MTGSGICSCMLKTFLLLHGLWQLAGKGLNVLRGNTQTGKMGDFYCGHPFGKVPLREQDIGYTEICAIKPGSQYLVIISEILCQTDLCK